MLKRIESNYGAAGHVSCKKAIHQQSYSSYKGMHHKVGIFKAFRVVIMHQLSFLFISVVETLEAQPAKNDVRRGIQAT